VTRRAKREDGAGYPVDTLEQMAAIPVDVLPRFLAELPVMLSEIRKIKMAVDITNEAMGEDVLKAPALVGVVWIDDDLKEYTTTIDFAGFGDEYPDGIKLHGKIDSLSPVTDTLGHLLGRAAQHDGTASFSEGE